MKSQKNDNSEIKANMAVCAKRTEKDIMKLLMSDYKVQPCINSEHEFIVDFYGPKDSCYENGMWKVLVHIPQLYPYKSPSIGFLNKIFHPNIDEAYSIINFIYF